MDPQFQKNPKFQKKPKLQTNPKEDQISKETQITNVIVTSWIEEILVVIWKSLCKMHSLCESLQ